MLRRQPARCGWLVMDAPQATPHVNWSASPTSGWGILSMCQQKLPENDGIVVRLVVRRIDECDRTFKRQVAQPIKFLAMLLDLLGIPPAEFRPSGGIVSEPFSQLGAWRQFLRPIINCRIGLLHSARPQPINQDPRAVAVRRILLGTLQLDVLPGNFGAHARRSLLPCPSQR